MKRDIIIKKMTMMAMFAALSYVLTLIAHYLHLQIIPSISFLSYDPKDILICIASFVLGPIGGVIISIVVSFLEMVTFSITGFYGFIMNIISTCALILPASLIYKHKKSFIGAILSLFIGFLCVNIIMTLWNMIITPIYMDIEREVLIQNYLGLIIVFNMIKAGMNIALILIFYKPCTRILKGIHLVEKKNEQSNLKTSLTMTLIGVILLIVLIIIVILLKIFS